MTPALWIALILLILASIIPKSNKGRFILGGAGWSFLSIYWIFQPGNIDIKDYVNAILGVAAGGISIFIAYIMFRAWKREESEYDVFISLSRAASVGGLLYFLFAEIEYLNRGIISTVTDQAVWTASRLNIPVEQVAWNQFAVNGLTVEIILACTAIESIALFSGLISSAEGASSDRKLRAFIFSVPVIYILNLQRVIFTASAYGFSWFGTPDESFYISEHIITKAGSLLALLIISYMVLKTLPEASDMIDGVVKTLRVEIRRLSG